MFDSSLASSARLPEQYLLPLACTGALLMINLLIAACTWFLCGCCFLDANIEESGLGSGMLAQLSNFVHAASCGFLLLPLAPSL